MAEKKFPAVLILLVLSVLLASCNNQEGKQNGAAFTKLPEISYIKPQKPIKIKVKRGVNGNYSWDLTGDDAERIIQVTKQLTESLTMDAAGQK